MISSATPFVSAAAASTASISRSAPSRSGIMRPVGCPMISTCGLRMALSRRSVTCSRGWRRPVCSEAQHDIQLRQHFVGEVQRCRRRGSPPRRPAAGGSNRPTRRCTASISWRWRRTSSMVSPPATPRLTQWSVIASSWTPRAVAACAISRIESLPSLQVEWVCSSARDVRQLDQAGQVAGAAPPAPRRGPRAARAGCRASPGRRRLPLRDRAQDFAPILALQGVLGERESLLERQLAQAHVVVLGAGGVLQGGAEALRRVHPQLGAQAVGELHAGFVLALPEDAHHVRVAHESLHHRLRIGGGYQDVQVAHRGAHAAQAAGDLRRLHARLTGAETASSSWAKGQALPERDAVAAPRERFDAERGSWLRISRPCRAGCAACRRAPRLPARPGW